MWHGLRPVSPIDRTWQESPFGRYLLVSAFAHGLAFSAWLAMPPAKSVLPAVFQVALLPAPPQASGEAQREVASKPSDHRVTATARPALPKPPVIAIAHEAPKAVVTEKPASMTVAKATPAASPSHQESAAQLASATAAAPAAPAVTGAAAAPAEIRRDLSPAALDAYAQSLSALLARQRNYPAAAAMRGWEGEVRLTLRIARRGVLLEVVVQHSSGYEVLDRNAVQLVQQAAPLPQPPEGLEASEFQVSVPIQYRLKKS